MRIKIIMRNLIPIAVEKNILGGALVLPDALLEVQEAGLQEKHFGHLAHRSIWAVVTELSACGKPVDVITVAECLEGRGELGGVGGFPYLSEIAKSMVSVVNISDYVLRVREAAAERLWLDVSNRVRDILFEECPDTHETRMARIDSLIMKMGDSSCGEPAGVSLDMALRDAIESIDDKFNDRVSMGLLTGFKHIDYRMTGMQPGDLMVVAGRPGMGKTSYAMAIVIAAAKQFVDDAKGDELCKQVLVFSEEMAARALAMRAIASAGKVKLSFMRSGKIAGDETQWSKLSAGVSKLKGLPVHFFDDGGDTVADVCSYTRRLNRKQPVGLVVVDHIGLLEGSNSFDNANARLSEISRRLKLLAKTMGCPVMALSQVNRGCEGRANKRPLCSDLRDSGAIEQDADVIQFVYRDEFYDVDTPYPGQVEIISAKLREGEVGTDYLSWQGQYNRLDSIDREHVEQDSYSGASASPLA